MSVCVCVRTHVRSDVRVGYIHLRPCEAVYLG